MRFNKENYMLSFSVEGISVFVTDIHQEAYADLEVLYIIDKGLFKQYFTTKAFQRALDNGLKFYSNKSTFDSFQKELNDHCKKFKLFFESDIKESTSKCVNLVENYIKKVKNPFDGLAANS